MVVIAVVVGFIFPALFGYPAAFLYSQYNLFPAFIEWVANLDKIPIEDLRRYQIGAVLNIGIYFFFFAALLSIAVASMVLVIKESKIKLSLLFRSINQFK